MSPLIYTDEYGRIRSNMGKPNYKPYRPSDPSKSINYDGENAINGIVRFPEYKDYRDSFLYQTTCDCPECNNKIIFYCKCKNGGRVFFESLFPEWKKHKCPCYQQDNYTIEKKTSIKSLYKNLYPHSYNKENKQLIYNDNEGLNDFNLSCEYNSILYKNLTNNIHLLYRIEEQTIHMRILGFNYKKLYKDHKFDNIDNIISFLESRLTDTEFSTYKSLKDTKKINSKKKKTNFNSIFEDFFSN